MEIDSSKYYILTTKGGSCVCVLIKKSFLAFILLSLVSTEFHIAGRKIRKSKKALLLPVWSTGLQQWMYSRVEKISSLRGGCQAKLLITTSLHLCSCLKFVGKKNSCQSFPSSWTAFYLLQPRMKVWLLTPKGWWIFYMPT